MAAVITILTFASRRLGFSRADEITVVFCGSKKSLASGLPIATLLFAGHVGLVIIPVMVFHQIQLMVCASLARRYAARRPTATEHLSEQPADLSVPAFRDRALARSELFVAQDEIENRSVLHDALEELDVES